MPQTDAPGLMPGKLLIERDRVAGTAVYDPNGNRIGTIKRLMIEKISGRVVYAAKSFGVLGLGEEEHTIPWNKLTYDTSLGDTTPTSLRTNFGALRPSPAIRTASGRIAIESANCTTATVLGITGAAGSEHRGAQVRNTSGETTMFGTVAIWVR